MSCENNSGNVWIDFELSDVKRLVRKVKRNSDLTDFLVHCLKEFQWDYDDDEWCHGGGDDFYTVAIRFPCRYKEAFEAFLAAW